MLKKVAHKPSLIAIASGAIGVALLGSLWLTPKVIGWVEQWKRTSEISFEDESNKPSVVLKLAMMGGEQREPQLKVLASAQQPSLDRSRARYLLATDLIKKYEGGPALLQLEGLEEEYPTLAPYILLKRGRAYELTNENEQARDTWKKLLETYPDSLAVAEALYYLAKYEPSYGDQAIAKFPQHPRTWELIQARLKENPKQPELMLLLVKYNVQDPAMNSIRDRLVKEYAAKLTTQDWEIIAEGYWQHGEYGKAAQAYRKGNRTARNLYRVARGLHLAGKKPEAKKAYQELLRSFPQAPETGQGMMHLVKLAGEKEALGYLDYVIGKFPEQAPEALLKKAEMLSRNNQKKAASEVLQTLLDKYPKSDTTAEYRWQIAEKYAKEGDLLKAWQWAQPITVNNPDSPVAPKAAFWIGKWAQKLGRSQDAQDAFTHTLGRYPQSYYAWRSAVQLGWEVGDFNNVRYHNPTITRPEEKQIPPSGSKAFKEFYRLGQNEQALMLFQAEVADPWNLTLEEQFTLGLLKETQHKYLKGINLIWDLKNRETPEEQQKWEILRQTPEYWQALFPFPYYGIIINWAQMRNLNPLLVTSLIRQESRFEKEIRSPVGATGLMQVMPSTGAWIGEKIGLKDYSLTNPNDNVNLGTWYLDHTHETYKNNSLLAVASYNAGPGNVDKWVKKYGVSDPDVFVENIPFKETRGYVESVFGNYWNYLRIYNPEISQLMSKLSN